MECIFWNEFACRSCYPINAFYSVILRYSVQHSVYRALLNMEDKVWHWQIRVSSATHNIYISRHTRARARVYSICKTIVIWMHNSGPFQYITARARTHTHIFIDVINYKLQTCNCLKEISRRKKNWSQVPDGRLTPGQTGRLTVGRK
jgi:hypothetical protein